jgi:hypothetical protein
VSEGKRTLKQRAFRELRECLFSIKRCSSLSKALTLHRTDLP